MLGLTNLRIKYHKTHRNKIYIASVPVEERDNKKPYSGTMYTAISKRLLM